MAFSFSGNDRAQLEQLVANPKFKSLTQLPIFAPMEIGLGLLAYGLFATSTWLYIDNVIHAVAMVLINSFAVYLSFTPLHDATHRTVSRSRRLNDAIGTWCCLLLLPGITTPVYRYLHLEHHRYAGNLDKDPDEPFVSAPAWQLPFVLAGLDVLWVTWYLRHWSTRPMSERIEFSMGVGFYVGIQRPHVRSGDALHTSSSTFGAVLPISSRVADWQKNICSTSANSFTVARCTRTNRSTL